MIQLRTSKLLIWLASLSLGSQVIEIISHLVFDQTNSSSDLVLRFVDGLILVGVYLVLKHLFKDYRWIMILFQLLVFFQLLLLASSIVVPGLLETISAWVLIVLMIALGALTLTKDNQAHQFKKKFRIVTYAWLLSFTIMFVILAWRFYDGGSIDKINNQDTYTFISIMKLIPGFAFLFFAYRIRLVLRS